MTIKTHEIPNLSVKKTPIKQIFGKLKIVAILASIYSLFMYFNNDRATIIDVIISVVCICIFAFLPIALYTHFKQLWSGFNLLGGEDPRRWQIELFLKDNLGSNISLSANSATLMADEEQGRLFYANQWQNVVLEIPFDDIRSWDKVILNPDTGRVKNLHTYWLYIGVTNTVKPIIKIQFGSEREIHDWMGRIDTWVNYS